MANWKKINKMKNVMLGINVASEVMTLKEWETKVMFEDEFDWIDKDKLMQDIERKITRLQGKQ